MRFLNHYLWAFVECSVTRSKEIKHKCRMVKAIYPFKEKTLFRGFNILSDDSIQRDRL